MCLIAVFGLVREGIRIHICDHQLHCLIVHEMSLIRATRKGDSPSTCTHGLGSCSPVPPPDPISSTIARSTTASRLAHSQCIYERLIVVLAQLADIALDV